ncbi:unnamed protein product, partial [Didymodactylos carnosus]
MSHLIIRTYLNSLTKTFDDLPHLTNDQFMKLIEKVSHQIDNYSNEPSMDSSSNSTDVSRDQSKQMMKMILEQHDLLVKALCSQHVSVSPAFVYSSQSALPPQMPSQTSSLTDNHIAMSHTHPTLSSTPVQKRKTTVPPLTPASTSRHKSLGRISDNDSSPTDQQNQSFNKEKQFELVTVAGSSIVKGLGNGTIDFSNKSFRYHIHTKHGAGIERMTEFMKEKHFKPSPRFI